MKSNLVLKIAYFNTLNFHFSINTCLSCTVPQNFNLLPFLYVSFVRVIRFMTNRKYAFILIARSDCHLTSITLICRIKIMTIYCY